MSRRTERVGEQLREEIARVLRQEVADPRVGLTTVTRVDVSPDLGHAAVYWSHLEARDEEEIERVAEGLAGASGFVRRQLARCLSLRRMPVLEFRHDRSLELGSQTLGLLKTLEDERKDRERDGET